MNVRVRPDADGRYSRAKLRTALGEICDAAGLDPGGARLIRFVNNAVFQLLAHPVVVRIVLSPSLRYRADNVVRAANWLAEHEVPAVRLLPGLPQPLHVNGHVATLWQAVPEVGQATGLELAQLLKRLHALPAPPGELPRWDPLADVRRRLADAEELDAGDREFLETRCAELEAELAAMEYHLPQGVIHGDAHVGNVISTPIGPLLCDLDSVCLGPREWDLTPLAVGKLRFRHTGDRYRQLSRAYGFDVTKWPGFPVLRQVRELKLTTGVLSILRSNPDVRTELAKRMQSFRSGDTRARWTPHR
ncbi:aminoglycoside phosphotransferase family protein [Crossiella sp. SN42]|uniref:phosphotransferase enzyme family protein n=1 Tax=Crossiella sp. SN42 TaxID=2944808 RepID=UPI00207C34FD|nr:phosphotransferase [Crossiella sp. SN42]MCO1581400.1 aminoglycoside phosphotransferase family protein [Crossiella sp. SN42]